MSPQHTPINPSTLKQRLTRKFLKALNNLKYNKSITTSRLSTKDINQRSRQVKLAAYESMASVAGSRCKWSRTITTLQKARNHARHRGLVRRKMVKVSTSHALKRIRKNTGKGRKRNKNPNPRKDNTEVEFGRELRKLVPGGEGMDMCKLLDETADYVKSLAAQVEVMRNILNFYSRT